MAESHGAAYSGGAQKARKYDIGNTNIAGLGTPLEEAVRRAAAECEDEWKKAGKKEGIEIWRIEQFKVVPWPKKKYGKFFSGDSYIVLHTFKSRNGQGALAWDVHFWIGSESSQDEYGTAAYKTVELDDYLGGGPTQYREIQGHESKRFRSLFKHIEIMEGGVDSGFNHVEEQSYRPRLLHVKGTLNVLVREVPLSYESLNQGDSFIYDGGLRIMLWHGSSAGPMEKNKAAATAQALVDERAGKPTKDVFSDGDKDLSEWWKALGGKGPIKPAEAGGDDAAVKASKKRLLRVSDARGKLQMTLVAEGNKIFRNQLDSDDVFVLDDGYEVFVWVGRGASRYERKSALNCAMQYLQSNGLPMETTISRVLDGGENEQFEAAFEIGVKDGKTHSGAAAASASAGYKGSGGPGHATDFDAVYAEQGADPKAWKGRHKGESAYAKELQAGKHGAYSASSGWVSGKTDAERADYARRVAHYEAHSGRGAKKAAATLKPAAGFNASADAAALRKAMKGWGCNHKVLIDILGHRTLEQRKKIQEAYTKEIERDLMDDLEGKTGHNYRRVLKCLFYSPVELDAYMLHKAFKGLGADKALLIEILCTQDNDGVRAIKDVYNQMYPENDLEQDVMDNTSGHVQEILILVLKCTRPSGSTPVDQALAAKDAKLLYEAGEKRWFGTDSQKFEDLFVHRSFPQLAATFDEYSKICKHDIRKSVQREFSFSTKMALQTIIDAVRDLTEFYCERIFKAIDGLGTNDFSLIRSVVSRSEIDMAAIKQMYPEKYQETLAEAIAGDTSGHYEDLLLALINEPRPVKKEGDSK